MDDVNAARATFREIETLQARVKELSERRRQQVQALLARYTQREVAALMGVSQPRICQLLRP